MYNLVLRDFELNEKQQLLPSGLVEHIHELIEAKKVTKELYDQVKAAVDQFDEYAKNGNSFRRINLNDIGQTDTYVRNENMYYFSKIISYNDYLPNVLTSERYKELHDFCEGMEFNEENIVNVVNHIAETTPNAVQESIYDIWQYLYKTTNKVSNSGNGFGNKIIYTDINVAFTKYSDNWHEEIKSFDSRYISPVLSNFAKLVNHAVEDYDFSQEHMLQIKEHDGNLYTFNNFSMKVFKGGSVHFLIDDYTKDAMNQLLSRGDRIYTNMQENTNDDEITR